MSLVGEGLIGDLDSRWIERRQLLVDLVEELNTIVLKPAPRDINPRGFGGSPGVGQLIEHERPSSRLKLMTKLDVRPDKLTLEVTEDAILEPGTAAVDELATLRRSGVRVALDDFGWVTHRLRASDSCPWIW